MYAMVLQNRLRHKISALVIPWYTMHKCDQLRAIVITYIQLALVDNTLHMTSLFYHLSP